MFTGFVRTVILYILIIAGIRLMGKRQVGELEPSELVLSLIIADLAAVPMQDYGIPLLSGVIPILTLLALTMILSVLTVKSITFRALLCGRPSVIIRNGRLDHREMARNRLTADELLEELRGKGCVDPAEVAYAVLETNGRLSVILRSEAKPASAREAGVRVAEAALPLVLVSDGRVLEHNLTALGRDRVWLDRRLLERNCPDLRQVFLLLADDRGSVYLSRKDERGGA